jgi:hypothetical protein
VCVFFSINVRTLTSHLVFFFVFSRVHTSV